MNYIKRASKVIGTDFAECNVVVTDLDECNVVEAYFDECIRRFERATRHEM